MNIPPEQLLATLANATRLRCLLLLRQRPELCVCELTQVLEVAQPHISRHLALLRERGLVLDRREGLWVHYRLHPDLPPWVQQSLAALAAGIGDTAPYRDDAQALAKLPSGPGAARCP